MTRDEAMQIVRMAVEIDEVPADFVETFLVLARKAAELIGGIDELANVSSDVREAIKKDEANGEDDEDES